jgi:hypothetical protein
MAMLPASLPLFSCQGSHVLFCSFFSFGGKESHVVFIRGRFNLVVVVF